MAGIAKDRKPDLLLGVIGVNLENKLGQRQRMKRCAEQDGILLLLVLMKENKLVCLKARETNVRPRTRRGIMRFSDMENTDKKTPIKILVVEDDRDVSYHMCRMLKAQGYVVFPAYNLQEALAAFDKEKPDICVIDVYLRFLSMEESGIDFFRIASKSEHKFKSVIVSGFCDDKMVEEIQHMPVDLFMPKPLDTDEFRNAIKKLANETLAER